MTHIDIDCPFCGEPFSFAAEASDGGSQRLVVDCEICCRPIVVRLTWDDEQFLTIHAEAE